ncbi:radical SAM protein [Candidatus Woesearchaeota archaeon]|jgi:anaerobic magnesium-protoporphyrin IX monomethyl ester cyclase|nr:radical SAM protein [Candidatus Woesearchaeota archaeon]
MTILLINPPQYYPLGEEPIITFPLGLGYLSSILSKFNFNHKVNDYFVKYLKTKIKYKNGIIYGKDPNEIKEEIKIIKPKIILITCQSSSQYFIVENIVNIIKKTLPTCNIIIGGNHVSSEYENILNNKNIDFLVIGEGEKTIITIIKNIYNKKKLKNVKGIGYRLNNNKIINPSLNNIKNLNKIPFPAWNKFPIKTYLKTKKSHSLLPYQGKTIQIITSRGCPYNCSFCATQKISGSKWRSRSVENIITEIRTLKKKYNIQNIEFVDDNIALDSKRFKLLLNELKKEKIKWCVPNGICTNHLNKKLIRQMKNSGCYALFLPIETGNNKIKKLFSNKKLSKKHILKIINFTKKIKLYVVGFFIIGFQEETKKDIIKTINFIKKLNLDEIQVSILTPLPGSKLFQKHQNLINNFDELTAKEVNIQSNYLSNKKIKKLRNKAYIDFELNKLINNPGSYLNKFQLQRIWRYVKYFIISHKKNEIYYK